MPLPTVLLHDHLDGGLRVATVLELADTYGYSDLPHWDEGDLAAWFDQSTSGSLETYLQAFTHTIAVMQHHEALERVAYETAIDLAADGVVYAEIRFCPALHTGGDLTHQEVIEAVSGGLRRGAAETGLEWRIIIDALRQLDHSMAMVRLAADSTGLGVVGFDLAGPEAPYPPTDHLAACRFARGAGLRLTLHAGEAAGARGVSYIASAMDVCGAERLGHGIEVIDDCVVEDGEITALGPVAQRVLDRQVPLEVCPSSNLATRRIDPEDHPVGALHRAGFNVTINTDNRLMSATSMSAELRLVEKYHGFEVDDLALVARRSLGAAFCDHATKVDLWERVIAPAYLSAGATLDRRWR